MIKEVLLCPLGVTNMSHDCQDETTNELPNDIPLRIMISWVVITIDRCQKTSFVTIPSYALFLYLSSPSVDINPLLQSHLLASTKSFMQQLHISLFVQTLDLICLAYNWTLMHVYLIFHWIWVLISRGECVPIWGTFEPLMLQADVKTDMVVSPPTSIVIILLVHSQCKVQFGCSFSEEEMMENRKEDPMGYLCFILGG